MRTENHCIPRLNRDNALEQHCRSGVRNGRDRKQDSDWFRDLHQVALGKLANDADGALVLDVVVDELAGHHILDDLVFHHSEPGFLHRQARQMLSVFQSSQDHGFDDAIDILLRELGKDGGGGSRLTDQAFEISNSLRT